MALPIDMVGEIPDPRRGDAQRHESLDILAIALAASVRGAESCADFAASAEDREPLSREFLNLDNGLPGHGAFSPVFRLLDPEAFARAFGAFIDALGVSGAGVLAIDGKTLLRWLDRAAGPSPLHLVIAFGTGAQATTGAGAAREVENEILAARARLGTLALDGPLACLVTTDADHGWAGRAVRHDISSPRFSSERFAEAVRAHWAIEASLHRALDLTFEEDRARNRKDNGPESLATLRRLTLNLPRKALSKLPAAGTQARGMVRRHRKSSPRPNAIALAKADRGLSQRRGGR